jgi:hypothetical protein
MKKSVQPSTPNKPAISGSNISQSNLFKPILWLTTVLCLLSLLLNCSSRGKSLSQKDLEALLPGGNWQPVLPMFQDSIPLKIFRDSPKRIYGFYSDSLFFIFFERSSTALAYYENFLGQLESGPFSLHYVPEMQEMGCKVHFNQGILLTALAKNCLLLNLSQSMDYDKSLIYFNKIKGW